jgi:hypothetical protein
MADAAKTPDAKQSRKKPRPHTVATLEVYVDQLENSIDRLKRLRASMEVHKIEPLKIPSTLNMLRGLDFIDAFCSAGHKAFRRALAGGDGDDLEDDADDDDEPKKPTRKKKTPA